MTNFYSIQFLLFLLLFLSAYYTVFRKKQWVCLLLASIVFYCYTGIENFIFLAITGFTTWAGANIIEGRTRALAAIRADKSLSKEKKSEKKNKVLKQRSTVMWCVVLCNFGILAALKYVPVVVNTTKGILLPLGISFYMFQSIGYLMDVYNEKCSPQRNFAKYMLFVSYFPQMIQGPINRYEKMGIQFDEIHMWDEERSTKAIYRIGYGLLKKYAIANVYVGIIAKIFDNPIDDYSGAMVLTGILLYSAQQYADFSGGIDIVLGISELFGITMNENFKQPYFATSLADFWRRWHISLGKWMRDYVFYPFALTKPMKKFGKWANKKLGKHLGRVLPAALGNILVFFIVGLWHGAKWHYIVWGLYNGVVIAFSDIFAPIYEKITVVLRINTKAIWFKLFQIIRTFIVVNIGWYFDRITNVKVALYSMKKTLLNFNIGEYTAERPVIYEGYYDYILGIALVTCMIVFIISVMKECKIDVRAKLYESPIIIRWGIYLIIIGLILFANTNTKGAGGFMYANF